MYQHHLDKERKKTIHMQSSRKKNNNIERDGEIKGYLTMLTENSKISPTKA